MENEIEEMAKLREEGAKALEEMGNSLREYQDELERTWERLLESREEVFRRAARLYFEEVGGHVNENVIQIAEQTDDLLIELSGHNAVGAILPIAFYLNGGDVQFSGKGGVRFKARKEEK